MPQRKSHTKSRRGCAGCKQRHVKCDEAIPSCGYCLKRDVVCSFITESRENTDSVKASPSNQSEPGALAFSQSAISRITELSLMHNWSTKAYRTLCQHSDETHLWQIVVPELALGHEYLLDALLALSARQLVIDASEKGSTWDRAALEYQNKALTGFQLVLGDVNLSNCEAVFACSILIMVFSMAQSHMEGKNHLSDAILDILELRQFLSGIGLLQNEYHDYLRLTSFGVLFTPHTPTQIESEDSTGVPLPDMCRMVESTLEHLRREIPDDVNAKSYSDSISDLQEAMQIYCTGGLFSGIMTWPVTLGDNMIHVIENREPLALAILAHFGIIIHLLRDRWWARSSGKRLVRTILPILRKSNVAWAVLVQQAWVAVVNDTSSLNTPSD
ncbi:hypothetical protein AUEXF2481DRAFT_31238 [Aureobasidium subglaciale EXF-2481]|uniref:Zn(2)-C6 fungal-type domain-containing protein n=1 Tax=Aureobasidium subglaciale (strain EXF-2481) TaxID=1043005 RepID=A0A074Y7C9_AURSE|nr:uncharacterized protein AUEXF2481DRAFT_31238 [Aureobasidium subglaciale EXF-2481]KEQ93673.1 hypothetical protein AUEXF2481DRAFT_31238 [Aureobasidium subglaciale EXF-2481]